MKHLIAQVVESSERLPQLVFSSTQGGNDNVAKTCYQRRKPSSVSHPSWAIILCASRHVASINAGFTHRSLAQHRVLRLHCLKPRHEHKQKQRVDRRWLEPKKNKTKWGAPEGGGPRQCKWLASWLAGRQASKLASWLTGWRLLAQKDLPPVIACGQEDIFILFTT